MSLLVAQASLATHVSPNTILRVFELHCLILANDEHPMTDDSLYVDVMLAIYLEAVTK